MEKVIGVSILITIVFCIVKCLEMKFIDKEFKPLKILVRELFVVFASSFVGLFMFFQMNNTITDFFNVVTETKVLNTAATQVFTGEPEF